MSDPDKKKFRVRRMSPEEREAQWSRDSKAVRGRGPNYVKSHIADQVKKDDEETP